MRKLILIGVACVSLLTFSGCGHVTTDPGIMESVRGVVLDSLNLAPIDSVGVRLNDTATPAPFFFTDTAGDFRATTGFGGKLQIIHFSKTGYITKTMARVEILSAISSDVAAKDSLVVMLMPKRRDSSIILSCAFCENQHGESAVLLSGVCATSQTPGRGR